MQSDQKRQIMPLAGHKQGELEKNSQITEGYVAYTPSSTPPNLRDAGMQGAKVYSPFSLSRRDMHSDSPGSTAGPWSEEKGKLDSVLAQQAAPGRSNDDDLQKFQAEVDAALKGEQEDGQEQDKPYGITAAKAAPAASHRDELMISTPTKAFMADQNTSHSTLLQRSPSRFLAGPRHRQTFLKQGWLLCPNCSKPCDVSWGRAKYT